MKSFLKPHAKQEELEYPCLKESNNLEGHTIVLFTAKDTGICVYTTAPNNYVGQHVNNWAEPELFKPFQGELILKN